MKDNKKLAILNKLYKAIDNLVAITFLLIVLISCITMLGGKELTVYGVITFIISITLLLVNGYIADKFKIEVVKNYKSRNQDYKEAKALYVVCIAFLAFNLI